MTDLTPEKPDYGTEDKCPKNEGGHEPDWDTVTVEPDGGAWYVDVACKHCGRSGCVGESDQLEKDICW